jgi:DNA-binding protein Fis
MRVLYAESNIKISDFVISVLKHHHIDYVLCPDLVSLETAWNSETNISSVITHAVMGERDMFSYVFYLMRKHKKSYPVISYSDTDIISNAMRAAQSGIYHFMPLPFSPVELIDILDILKNPALQSFEKKYPPSKKTISSAVPSAVPSATSGGLSDMFDTMLRQYFHAHQGALPPSGLYARILPEIERPLIKLCLEYTGGNRLKTADLLGLNRNTLRKKMTELGL